MTHQTSPETETLFQIFEAAYWAEWKVHHGTEPTQARRAGVVALLTHLSAGHAPRSDFSEAEVFMVAARLRGLNALKEDYGQIQNEKVRKALAAIVSDTSTDRDTKSG
jgi:hypothetical protein